MSFLFELWWPFCLISDHQLSVHFNTISWTSSSFPTFQWVINLQKDITIWIDLIRTRRFAFFLMFHFWSSSSSSFCSYFACTPTCMFYFDQSTYTHTHTRTFCRINRKEIGSISANFIGDLHLNCICQSLYICIFRGGGWGVSEEKKV